MGGLGLVLGICAGVVTTYEHYIFLEIIYVNHIIIIKKRGRLQGNLNIVDHCRTLGVGSTALCMMRRRVWSFEVCDGTCSWWCWG